jgi:hypothetical protein
LINNITSIAAATTTNQIATLESSDLAMSGELLKQGDARLLRIAKNTDSQKKSQEAVRERCREAGHGIDH